MEIFKIWSNEDKRGWRPLRYAIRDEDAGDIIETWS